MSVFDVITVGSSLHDEQSLAAAVAGPMQQVEAAGGKREAAPGAASGARRAVLVGTGGTEADIMAIWERRPAEPLLLLAHPDHNSLPSALEALARVQQLGGRGRIVYLDGADDAGLEAAVADLEAHHRLRATRIGLIGPPSDWLVASSPEPGMVGQVWGPEVVPVPIDRIVAAYHPSGGGDVERSKADAIEAALREVVAAESLDAVTVRCFDLIGSLDTTACLALSSLNDDDVIAGCEGDLVSAVGLLWVHYLLGEMPWMANPARLDVTADTITLAHCTVPRSLVSAHRLDTHFESGRGIGIAGEFRPGPVTVFRIGGSGMERIWLAEGEIVATGDDPALCRTQIEIGLDAGAVGDLLSSPLGNHLVVVPGRHRIRLRSWWEWLIRPI